MGNIIETFPVQIKDGFLKFKELFAQNIPDHEYLLQFTVLFKIPWIMAWKFIVIDAEGTTPMSLHRIVSVKWSKLSVQKFSGFQKFQKKNDTRRMIKTRQNNFSQLCQKDATIVKR